MTLQIPSELETRVREEAAKHGLDPGALALQTLAERFAKTPAPPPRLSARESELLGQINLGLSAETWGRYHDLREKLAAETLRPEEHAELMRIANEMELANARRLEPLAELAQLRGVPLPSLMKALGIRPGSEDPTGRSDE